MTLDHIVIVRIVFLMLTMMMLCREYIFGDGPTTKKKISMINTNSLCSVGHKLQYRVCVYEALTFHFMAVLCRCCCCCDICC